MKQPPWQTSTVIDLCKTMRHTQDFSATPILADALQDAGFTDEDVLTELRNTELPYLEAAPLVAEILLGEETVTAAILLISRMADELGPSSYENGHAVYDENHRYVDYMVDSTHHQPMNYVVLMETARDRLSGGDLLVQRDSERWRNAANDEWYKKFWTAYRVITGDERKPHNCPDDWNNYGDEIDEDEEFSFLGCSC